MRITIITALIVILLAELGLRLVEDRVPAALEWDDQFTQDKADQLDERDHVDLVVVGSSVANAEIDAAFIAGQQSGYNAALPSKTPRIWAEWFDDVVVEKQPDVVLIAVDIRQYNDNKPGATGQLDRYLTSDGRVAHVTGADDSLVSRIEDSFAITRLKSRIREPDKFFASVLGLDHADDWRDTNLDESGRYTNFDRRVFSHDQEVLDNLTDGAFKDFAVGGIEQDSLVRIVSSAKAIGADVVLLNTPSMRSYLTTALPDGESDFSAYEASLRAVAEIGGIEVLSYPDLDDREELFADYYHMNGSGTEVLSMRLREDLADLLGSG